MKGTTLGPGSGYRDGSSKRAGQRSREGARLASYKRRAGRCGTGLGIVLVSGTTLVLGPGPGLGLGRELNLGSKLFLSSGKNKVQFLEDYIRKEIYVELNSKGTVRHS